MTPEELDRALQEALSVEPPAGYVARVRARVAAEQAVADGPAWWPVGALAAALLVLVAGALTLDRQDSPVPVATVASHASSIARDRTTEPGQQATGHGPQATGRAAIGVPRRRIDPGNPDAVPRTADALPAVLVSPDDAVGLQLLATLPETTFSAAATDSGERPAPQISRIDVVPIEVDALPQLTPMVIGELQ